MMMMMMLAMKRQALHLLQRRDIKLAAANVSRRFPLVLGNGTANIRYSSGNRKTMFPPFVVMLKRNSKEKGHFVELH